MMIFSFLTLQLISLSQANRDDLFDVQPVTKPMQLLNSPHWVPEEQALYFVDIAGQGVHRYQPSTKKHTSIRLNGLVSVIIPIHGRKHEFIIGIGKNISLLSWDGISQKYALHHKIEVDKDKPENTFSEGKADHLGRLLIGTMGQKPMGGAVQNRGSLFSVSNTCVLNKVLSPITVSNGITWSKRNDLMYYADAERRKIDTFKYNEHDGKITDRMTFFNFGKNNITGLPDGMTIDTDGNLWIAVWDGGMVIQVSPFGQLLRSVLLPVQRPTSLAWGGRDLDTLYVTSRRLGYNSRQLKEQRDAGVLLEVKGLSARGFPANSVSTCYLSLHNIR